MRTFIAVDLDAESRGAVAGLIRRVAESVGGVRWVRPENIHVTLRFLGEIAPETRALVESALLDTAALTATFRLRLAGLGAFPSLRRPRVLWVGIGEGGEEMRRVHSMMEKRLSPAGVPPVGRPYTPHVTIGRIRRPTPSGDLPAIARSARLDAGFVVDRLLLKESRLTPEGAVHTVLCEAPLEGRPDNSGTSRTLGVK